MSSPLRTALLAAAWLHGINPTAPAPFNRPQPGIKQMVRIGAHTSAWVLWLKRVDDWTIIVPADQCGETVLLFFYQTGKESTHYRRL